MRADLRWLGLEWDWQALQGECGPAHAAALDRLAQRGLLYPCVCSRSQIRSHGLVGRDGGMLYPGTCRDRVLPASGWRATQAALRVRLEIPTAEIADQSGARLDPGERSLSDPIVRRRDGAIAYQLATVVDDAESQVTRIVRGRDLASSTGLQVALQHLLGVPTPVYRHHLLLLEERGDKLAKLHAAVSAAELRAHYSAPELCGVLAWLSALQPDAAPVTPQALVAGFDWQHVRDEDRVVRWTGSALEPA